MRRDRRLSLVMRRRSRGACLRPRARGEAGPGPATGAARRARPGGRHRRGLGQGARHAAREGRPAPGRRRPRLRREGRPRAVAAHDPRRAKLAPPAGLEMSMASKEFTPRVLPVLVGRGGPLPQPRPRLPQRLLAHRQEQVRPRALQGRREQDEILPRPRRRTCLLQHPPEDDRLPARAAEPLGRHAGRRRQLQHPRRRPRALHGQGLGRAAAASSRSEVEVSAGKPASGRFRARRERFPRAAAQEQVRPGLRRAGY